MISRHSPNFNERKLPVSILLFHYTGMLSTEDALERLCDNESQVSAHYLIDEGGHIFSLISEDHRAWHAGKSYWQGLSDINGASIGIELSNPGHAFGYVPFPPDQIRSLKKLSHDILARHPLITFDRVLGHSDVAPTRKQDPGEFFPWQEFAEEGIGRWPEHSSRKLLAQDVPQALVTLGYNLSDVKDHFEDVLLAFKRHFVPEDLSPKIDELTCSRLHSLIRNKP